MLPAHPAAAEAADPPEAEVEEAAAADGDPACRKAVFFKITKNRVSIARSPGTIRPDPCLDSGENTESNRREQR